MANPEHLQILEQGVEAWNAWRAQNGSMRPDLSGATLIGADLSRANLYRAILFHAHLFQANLLRADLSGANLGGADLLQADLTGANLSGASFGGANLTMANFTGANLSGASFGGANLSRANLSHVRLYETIFSDTTLTAVQGLETCDHEAPSTLDHRTLAKSGPLPLVFLRGCGLPEALIEYLPSLLGETIQFYSCFISYRLSDSIGEILYGG
jgi:hypothetical protein